MCVIGLNWAFYATYLDDDSSAFAAHLSTHFGGNQSVRFGQINATYLENNATYLENNATYLDNDSSAFADHFGGKGYSFQSFAATALFFGVVRSLVLFGFFVFCVYLYMFKGGIPCGSTMDKDERKRFLIFTTALVYGTTVVLADIPQAAQAIIYMKFADLDVIPSAIVAIGAADGLIVAYTSASFIYSSWGKISQPIVIPATMLLWAKFVMVWILYVEGMADNTSMFALTYPLYGQFVDAAVVFCAIRTIMTLLSFGWFVHIIATHTIGRLDNIDDFMWAGVPVIILGVSMVLTDLPQLIITGIYFNYATTDWLAIVVILATLISCLPPIAVALASPSVFPSNVGHIASTLFCICNAIILWTFYASEPRFSSDNTGRTLVLTACCTRSLWLFGYAAVTAKAVFFSGNWKNLFEYTDLNDSPDFMISPIMSKLSCLTFVTSDIPLIAAMWMHITVVEAISGTAWAIIVIVGIACIYHVGTIFVYVSSFSKRNSSGSYESRILVRGVLLFWLLLIGVICTLAWAFYAQVLADDWIERVLDGDGINAHSFKAALFSFAVIYAVGFGLWAVRSLQEPFSEKLKFHRQDMFQVLLGDIPLIILACVYIRSASEVNSNFHLHLSMPANVSLAQGQCCSVWPCSGFSFCWRVRYVHGIAAL